jgi:hypothetical protein
VLISYVDDMVICCRGKTEEALIAMRIIMAKLKLTVNENQDAGREAAGREVRFSSVHVWSLLLADNGTRSFGFGTVKEAGDPHLSRDQ